jgi:hypothetical protein
MEDIDDMIWVRAHPTEKHFGDTVDEEIIEDANSLCVFNHRDVARVDGIEVLVARIPSSKREEWVKDQGIGTSDFRFLGNHANAGGKHVLLLSDAVALIRSPPARDFPLFGERATAEFLNSEGPGSLALYHQTWAKTMGVFRLLS